MKKLLLIALVVCVAFVGRAQAQSADISLSTIPSDPQPSQKVTITAESFGMDLNQANITWRYNGRVIDGGIGRTSITLTAPASGAVGTVTASTGGGGLESITATLVLRPASVDLLWEAADSYTPPFYKGKALPSTNSLIRVTGIPGSSAPKQLVYTWSRNDSVLGSLSGYGKSSLLFKNSELVPTEKIAVTAASGAFSGTANLTIVPGQPSVVAYQKDEGFIDYANGASSSITTDQNGLIVHFEPYFFSLPSTMKNSLAFTISEGDTEVTNSTTQNELSLSAPEGRGQSVFMVAINTIAYTMQNLTRNFTINFN